MKWYKGKDGKVSSMRLAMMVSVFVGSITVLSSVIAMFMRIPECTLIAGVGAGLMGIGEIAKAFQATKE